MTISLVLTVIADDQPGIVEQVVAVISDHQGNWLESRMVQLAGQFAGIARVELATDKVDSLSTALNALGSSGLVVHLQPGSHSQTDVPETLALHVLGPDRQGIVREISRSRRRSSLQAFPSARNLPRDRPPRSQARL